MADEIEPENGKPDKSLQAMGPVGIVFFIVGIVFMLTMENKAIGLPFIALGISFGALSLSSRKKKPERPVEPPI